MANENLQSREQAAVDAELEGAHLSERELFSSGSAVFGPPLRLSWPAIFGGAVAALGLWAMLYTFGLALGLSTVNPNDPGSVKSSGIFTGIWSLLSPLIALFLGGMVASRGAGMMTRLGGALHGLIMWGLTTLVGAWLLSYVVGTLVSGVASVGKTAVEAGSQVVSGAARESGGLGELARTFGLDADDALAPLNQRLREEGKPVITAEQLRAATQSVIQESLRQGRIDRQLLISNVAQSTALSPADAEDVAMRVESQFNAAMTKMNTQMDSAKQTIQQGTLKAADVTGKAFWGVFGALFLGMISAIFGAITGVSKRQRAWAGEQPRDAGSVAAPHPRGGLPAA
ncbi:MAG: hypothetical protein K1X64_02275 [Myxococcaceae bacterium]|nr:hypothetical protein [Myxococcaceae bacterium]